MQIFCYMSYNLRLEVKNAVCLWKYTFEIVPEIITFFFSRLKIFRFLQIILENQKTWEWKEKQNWRDALIVLFLGKEASAAIQEKFKRKAENKPNSLAFFACHHSHFLQQETLILSEYAIITAIRTLLAPGGLSQGLGPIVYALYKHIEELIVKLF